MKRHLKNISIIALGVVATNLFMWAGFRGCKSDSGDNSQIKRDIAKVKERKDSVRTVIIYRDSVRTKLIYRWRNIRDTIYVPERCDTLFQTITSACDSALAADCCLIASLKAEQAVSDTIIDKQGRLIGSLEQEDTGLKKEVKRQKLKKAFAWIVAGIAGASHLLR